MGNSLGDCGCGDAKDAIIRGGPSAPKQRHVGVPPTTKVEDDAVVVGPDRAIQALIKSVRNIISTYTSDGFIFHIEFFFFYSLLNFAVKLLLVYYFIRFISKVQLKKNIFYLFMPYLFIFY